MKNLYLVNLNKNKSETKFISQTLVGKIEESTEKWQKVILYLNRRWEFSSLLCTSCQKIYECDHCNIALKVHNNWKLICHSCSYSKNTPHICEYCWSSELLKIWIWTQQIEYWIKKLFPNLNVFRFDTDNIKNISEKKDALSKLKSADIIIWTKMITTWFDFDKVWVIWIVLLEQELWIPDFRTEEKVYSNIKQVIWRGWRKWQESDIIIQTYIPDNPLVKGIVEDNYKDFMLKCLEERKMFWYPPFKEYAEIIIKDKNLEAAEKKQDKFEEKLKNIKEDWIQIIKNSNYAKRNNVFILKISVKWNNLRSFLQNIKKDIFRDRSLNIEFK